MIFAMARDGRTPVLPALITGALTIALLLVNIGNQRVLKGSFVRRAAFRSASRRATGATEVQRPAAQRHSRGPGRPR